MSANLIVDLGGTVDTRASIAISGLVDTAVGEIVDLLHADTNCNVFVAGGVTSGPIQVAIQTSEGLTSGSFTDPTSGLPQFPPGVVSGGLFYANSGLPASGNQSVSSPVDAAPIFCSGGMQFASFQRPHRYARLVASGLNVTAPVVAGFISQKRTTGSGGGFTLAPGSGTVNV